MLNSSARTIEFYNFSDDLDQVILMVQAVGQAGLAQLREVEIQTSGLLQKVAGIDAKAFAKLSAAERVQASNAASPHDAAAMTRLAEKTEGYLHLGTKTAPSVVLVYLVARFESYLSGIALSVCLSRPHLLGPITSATEEELYRRVSAALDTKTMDEVSVFFQDKLGIPFPRICTQAKTTIRELDKAKGLRNIHLHNRGYLNARNKKRVDLNLPLNTYCPISVGYLNQVKDQMYNVVLQLDKEMLRRYPDMLTR